MADFLKIGDREFNLDQVANADLDYMTERGERLVMLHFADGDVLLLSPIYSDLYREYAAEHRPRQGDDIG